MARLISLAIAGWLLASLSLLTACGQKGDLYLPKSNDSASQLIQTPSEPTSL